MAPRNFKTPEDRDQSALLPPRLDDYVNEGNHVRAIDCYVENRDLESLGFLHASGGLKAGQPAYHPKELAKLYIYGYLHKSRSSRHLEDEARRNLELIWLLGNLQPSHATIANFRKNNANALVALNKDFLLTCKEMALFGGTSIAIDGSYFRANASKDGIVSQVKLSNQISGLEQRIKEWQGILPGTILFIMKKTKLIPAPIIRSWCNTKMTPLRTVKFDTGLAAKHQPAKNVHFAHPVWEKKPRPKLYIAGSMKRC